MNPGVPSVLRENMNGLLGKPLQAIFVLGEGAKWELRQYSSMVDISKKFCDLTML